jgi:uncharacterized protein YggE
MNGVAINANQDAAKMNVAESIVLRVQSIDQLQDDQVIDAVVRVVDAAKDAGLTVSAVLFKSTHLETAKAAAVRAAVQAARQKADLLASLSNARVGPVVAIRETSSSIANELQPVENAEGDDSMTINGIAYQAMSAGKPLAPLNVRAAVNVEFALERGGTSK